MSSTLTRDDSGELEDLRKSVQRLSTLLEMTRVLSSELEFDRLIRTIMERTTELLDADRSTLFLVDEENDQLWSRVAQGEGISEIRIPRSAGIAGFVATSGQTVNIPEAYADPRFNPEVDRQTGYHTDTILCMPVREGNAKVVGVIQVLNKHTGAFTQDDQNLLGAFCVQAAVALANARQVEARRKEMEKSASLLNLMRTVSSELDLNDLLEQTMARTTTVMNVERCRMYIADQDTQYLWTKVRVGDELREVKVPFGVGVPGFTVATGQPLLIPDAYADFRFDPSIDNLTGQRTQNLLCMPLFNSAGRTIGVLEAVNKRGGEFTREDEELLNAVANQEVIALENAHLYADLRQMEAYNQSILTSMSTGIVTIDMLGRIGTINPAAIRILGYASKTEVPIRFKEAIRGEENFRLWDWVARTLAAGLPGPMAGIDEELDFKSANGSLLILKFTSLPLRDHLHNQTGVIVALEDISREKQLIGTLSRVVSKQVAAQLVASGTLPVVGGERKRVTVLMSDIRDFTPMTEVSTPEEIVEMLNDYFRRMITIVFNYQGTLDKFVGDAIVAEFGTPISYENNPALAVYAAVRMRRALREFNESRIAAGKFPIQIGIGIADGEAISGAIGSDQRLEFTVIGDTVNTAARLEGMTKGFPEHKIVFNESVYERVKDLVPCEFVSEEHVKGKAEPVRIYGIPEAFVHSSDAERLTPQP